MKQINKRQARKLYGQGKTFWMTACNMRPEAGVLINGDPAHTYGTDFDKLYYAFCFYNCNAECGRYPRFYVEG